VAQAQTTESALSAQLRQLQLPSDGIRLDFPPLADTGNAVPLHANIDVPAGLQVTSIEVVLPENPNPRVLTLRLAQPQVRYTFSTRLRLAASQDVWVLATLSDGTRRAASAPTVITSSACFDGT
jgi:predicted secreted protein